MTDITPSMFQYREFCRHLWNSYFLKLQWEETIWDMLETFDAVSELLFQDTVLKKYFDANNRKPIVTNFYAAIKVEPELGPIGCQAMWSDSTGRRGQWNIIQLTSRENDFRFMEFFDWTVELTMECQYTRVKLIASDEYPELVSNDFLLDTWSVKFKKTD